MKFSRQAFFLVLLTFLASACGSETSENTEGVSNGLASNEGSSTPATEGAASKPLNPQDEFSAVVAQAFVGKSKEQIMENVDRLIDPEIGLYLIYKPGVAVVAKRHSSAEELKATYAYLDETLSQISEAPKKTDELPYYDCETFDREGDFYKEVEKGGRIKFAMDQEKEFLYTEFTEEEEQQAEKAENAISRVLVSTKGLVELSFGQVGGAWKLIAINIGDYDCGA